MKKIVLKRMHDILGSQFYQMTRQFLLVTPKLWLKDIRDLSFTTSFLKPQDLIFNLVISLEVVLIIIFMISI